MDMLTIFVALTAIAILLQAGLLLGMYLTMRKSTERMEALASEVRTKVLPTLEQVQEVFTDVRPKVTTIVANAEHATTVLRGQLERIDATVNDVVDRARLQIIRGGAADCRLSRTPSLRIDAGHHRGLGVFFRARPQKRRGPRRTPPRSSG